jgi:Kelch motif protein/galactose oxidase-like protein
MKKKSTSQSAFFNLRILTASVFCLLGIAVALFAQGKVAKQTQQNNRSTRAQDAPGTQRPDVVQMVGPVMLNTNLRDLPYVAPKEEFDERVLTRYPHGTGAPPTAAPSSPWLQRLIKNLWRPTPTMPGPLLTFEGESAAEACACAPPDSDGDVGPNHYVEAINVAFRVFDKTGTPLSPVTTYNSFFSSLAGTPCANANDGDPFVLYDHLADRWVISDFAFPAFPGNSFWQCVGVSQSPDPVAGPWALYAIQIDSANPTQLGDYPKFAMWDSGGNPDQNAYFFTVNLFINNTTFVGVRAFALDRESMLTGGPANAIAFTVPLAGVGDSYSFVPATFRTGDPPPAGRDEMVLAIDSPANGGVALTQVHARFFHVDFVTPANSTFGVGGNHTPNAEITVDPFVDAFTNGAGFSIVPQQGTADRIQTLGDKIMTPMVYQNRGGTESLWASGTVCQDANCTQPTGVRWYQVDVTGGTFPANPVQQQTWTNAGDGLYRFMSSIAVDNSGNTAIGYAASSSNDHPGIRYAGRLESDPPGNLGQGENTLFTGAGSQTDTNGRWGDYSYTAIDPADNMTFWTVGEYYATTSAFNWHTRVGSFNFVGGGASPTPSPTATPSGCTWSAGPDMPSVGVRLAGVFFPGNGKFYGMGGRSSDVAGSEFTHPFEYDPGTNAWTTKSATYPDIQVNNIACGVLNESGTDYIYCVGGSDVASQTTTGRVFRYDPIADTLSTIGDPWPPGAATTTLPGGFTVANNKLYILGGFDIPGGNAITDIWEFDPSTNAWVQKSAVLPVPLGYIPTTTIAGLIYTGGGSDITGGLLTDTTNSFKYDPVADVISTIAPIPRATGETRALNFNGQMYVMGGGRVAPNPSNEVDIYDPGTDTWSIGIPFVTGRRNFPTDTNGTDTIWLSGGYDTTGVPVASMEIFNCPQVSPTPTATATATATITPPPVSPTPSATRPPPTPRPRPTPHPRP